MEATLKRALESILEQIDERFEVVIIDDGSSDKSIDIIKDLQLKYQNLRLVPLARDSSRHLGQTRNMSVQEARGEYVLLHLDCDDIAAPFIVDFTNVFHQIEACVKKDFLLSGRPIQMGKKDFLLKHGPYRNIHRGEDRDMWGRLAAIDAYINLSNKSLKTILPKPLSEKLYRAFFYTFDHLRNDFRSRTTLKEFLRYEIFHQKQFSFQFRLIRFAMVIPAYLMAKYQGPMVVEQTQSSFADFAKYREKNGGSFTEIMHKNHCEPDWSQLKPEAKSIF